MARTRIVAGLRANRVVTGQNRWPIWRRKLGGFVRWVAEKEAGPFFFNLLTGFLATHTDWLQALSPSSYRRRYVTQKKNKTDEDALVPSRTIVIAQDKMAARRLVFLLSAFLPATQQFPTVRTHRPSTSTSFGGAFSQSPPSFVVPILKEESLRRKINRRGGPRRASHSRNLSQPSHTRSGTVPGTSRISQWTPDTSGGHPIRHQLERRICPFRAAIPPPEEQCCHDDDDHRRDKHSAFFLPCTDPNIWGIIGPEAVAAWPQTT